MTAPKTCARLAAATVCASEANASVTLAGKERTAGLPKNSKAQKVAFLALETASASTASASATLVSKARVAKRKASAQRTVQSMVFAGKESASATQDGADLHAASSPIRRTARTIALGTTVSVTTVSVCALRNTLALAANIRRSAQTTAVATANATWDNACAPRASRAMRARKISHATVMEKGPAKPVAATVCRAMKEKAARLRPSARKTAPATVFAAGRPAIAFLAMLAKRVRETQRRCGNKAVYPLVAQPTVTAMASAGMAWEITTVTL